MFIIPKKTSHLVLSHLIRSWESCRSKNSLNNWTQNLSQVVLSYVPSLFWDVSTVSTLFHEDEAPKEVMELQNNNVLYHVPNNSVLGAFYCLILAVDTISSGSHHWKVKIINATFEVWSILLGIFRIDTLEQLTDLAEPPNAYGLHISSDCSYIQYDSVQYSGPTIPNIKIKNLDIIDFYLCFEKNSFKMSLNGEIVKNCDFIKNYSNDIKNESIENGLYKFGFISGNHCNKIQILEYDCQNLKI